MKSPLKKSIGEVVTDYGAKVMKVFKEGLLGRSLFDFYGDVKALTFRTKEVTTVPTTPPDGKGGVIYTKNADGKLYYKSNEISEVELSSQGTNTTYSVSCVDGDNSDEEKIRLTGSDSSTDDVVLEAGTGLSIARDGDKITFTNTVTDTDTVLTTEQVQDIAGALVATGGTKTGITVTYDDDNNNMDFVVASDLNTTGTAGGLSSTLVVSSGGTGATTFTSGHILRGNGTGALTSNTDLQFDGNNLLIQSSTSTKPRVSINSTNSDAEAPELVLKKGTAGTDGDDLGKLIFGGFDPDGNEHTFAQALGEIVVAANGSEEGKLTLSVASHDAELQPGLILASGNAEDEVDVTIGNEATSVTTVAGTLTMGSTATLNNSGVLQVAAQPNITSLGTLTNLDVDSVNINNKRITIVGDTDDGVTITSTTHGATTIETTDTAAAQAHLSLIADGNITLTSAFISAETDDFQISSTTDGHPTLLIENGGNNSTGGELRFNSKRGNAGVDNDVLGGINFTGPNHDGSQLGIFYGQIIGSIGESNDTDEAGKLGFYVAASDGSTSSTVLGLSIGGSSTDGTVNVSIGQGTHSLTTLAGDLQVTGNSIKDDDGTICITFDSTGGTSVAKELTVGSSQDQVLVLNTTSATGNPFIDFSQNGSRKSFIQHNDTSDTLKIASEFGAISLQTASDGNQVERLGISSAGVVSTSSNLTVGGDLTVSGNDIKDSGGNTIMSSNGSGDVTFGGTNILLDGSNANLKFDSGSDIILGNDVNGGDGTSNINYRDSGGTARIMLGPAGSDVVALANRASNGTVQIRANSSTAGSSGEVTVVTVEDDKVTISQELEVQQALTAKIRKFDLPADGAGNGNGDVVYIGLNDPSGGTGLTAGKIYYFKSSSGAWEEAQANNVAKSGPVLLGVALGTTPATHGVLLRGTIDLAVDITGTEAVGSVLYLDDVNAAAATATGPTTVGSDVVRIIGYSLSASNVNKIWFNPDNTYIEL